jgi:Flp pilus assembly protein TadB
MAQTKRKRRTKHRGTAAGTIQARGRTGRPPTPEERKRQTREQAREERLLKQPTWRSSFNRAALAGVFMFIFLLLFGSKHDRFVSAAVFAVLALVVYVPAGYYLELVLWRRRMRRLGRPLPPSRPTTKRR